MSAVVESWHRFDIRRIDDLSNAVLGADLEAIQLAGARVHGSLAFAAHDGIIFSSGLIGGSVSIRGPLSANGITLGAIVQTGPGTRLWLSELVAGDVGVVQPGDECDIICTPGSLYVAATLTPRRLRKEAANEGLALDSRLVSTTGLHSTPMKSLALNHLRKQVAGIHRSRSNKNGKSAVGSEMLRAVLKHYADFPRIDDARLRPAGAAEIVNTAGEYIRRNLGRPISVDALSRATATSRRSLFRAFSEVLGESPQGYVRRLRLHRIRRELISGARTVSDAAHNWGMSGDLGRLSRNYRDLFGENPSDTLALGRTLLRDDAWL
ncbi:AraC-like DNA-binding protein [Bradyrhizobium sp. F1.4.3]|uniref:AraC family transcriptional regulator n=1 Tax=Bradyrhizobium sp. F1.4.3 TaxID=3156356 RepID=UPI003392C3F7